MYSRRAKERSWIIMAYISLRPLTIATAVHFFPEDQFLGFSGSLSQSSSSIEVLSTRFFRSVEDVYLAVWTSVGANFSAL